MAFKALTLNTPPEQAAHILAEDDAAIYAALMGDDRVLDIGNKLAATVITNNSVRISDGVAVVGGHAGRIIKGDYEDMTIENGTSGKKRNDLICARFISNGNTDTYRLIVVKGASGTTAVDPTIVRGNLYNGDKQRDFPLWRVCLDGLSITKIEQMFTVSATNKYLADKTASLQTSVNQLNSNFRPPYKIIKYGLCSASTNRLLRLSIDVDGKVTYALTADTAKGVGVNINETFVARSK
ncbi:MAG: hypothetical protein KH304_10605 [Clostridium sp.]|nr:hypothetical protein [Clostridium sp.]